MVTASLSQRPRPLRRRGAARVIAEHAAARGTGDDDGLVCRPDGWYWGATEGARGFGPFASGALARADRDREAEHAPAEGESLLEAENELGLADWIDPDTGAPAEGLSTPHLAPD